MVGPWRLLRPLGRGGMGTVWLAQRSDGHHTGCAAIKFPRLAVLAASGEERFRREGHILARLVHPHIARLIDAGVAEDHQPYLVLEHVEGEPIDLWCDERRLGVESRVRLFLDVLAAVAHAHGNLVLHRDLKPGNILVDAKGNVKLLDFGVAKLIDAASPAEPTALTRDAGSMLTPAYAAPEQLRGEALTMATDVYALGVLLFELLAGARPHPVANIADALRTVDSEAPKLSERARATGATVAALRGTAPSPLFRALRGDLDNIASKALRKTPAERYQSAAAFADDLRRLLAHEPVSACADSLVYRVAKFVRRHRVGVAVGTLAALALGVGAGGIAWLSHEATQQRDFALRQMSHAEAVNDLNAFLLHDAAPGGAPITIGGLMERAERLAGNEHAGDAANRVAMLVAIGDGYLEHEQHEQARAVLRRALGLAENLPDPALRAVTFCSWGYVLSRDGHHAQARRLIDEELKRLPAQSPFALARASCLRRLAEVSRHSNDGATAVSSMEAARDALRNVPLRLPLRELAVLTQLGSAYRIADRQRDAIATFEEAYELLRRLGREDTEKAGTLLNEWGNALSNIGRPAAAEPLFRRAVALASSAADADTLSPALLNNLGRVQLQLGRHEEALASAEQGRARALRAGEEYGVMNLGVLRVQVHLARQEIDLAASALDETESLAARLATPKHVLHAILLMLRGDVAGARGDLPSALAFYDRAANFQYSGSVRTRANVFEKRSALFVSLQRPAEAVRDAREALRLRSAALEPGWRSVELGSAQFALGEALRAQAEVAAARAAFAEAHAHFAAALGEDHPRTLAARRLSTGSA
jgi:eukaryotic-like serine/threonine-protein kinase